VQRKHGKGKAKARQRQGKGKAKARQRQGKGKAKARARAQHAVPLQEKGDALRIGHAFLIANMEY
jgi:hypothetical protein